ncbi:MAG: DUF2807 domain-containing protein [Dysgonamonadaceae bacterium]|jgi:phage shock protein PspC (stress-responsive transcriptional regulator)|nr:DUF2807 domain-containing protein [Dysgonamonadaceae bacterium]
MKKTITANLNGRVFVIDEDAYQLLDNYLRNLKIYFRKETDASEIIADFESRIEELFTEKIHLGYQVINIEQVEEVIARIGKPTDFQTEGEVKSEEEKLKDHKEDKEYKEVKKKLFRDTDDKIIGGVCSGIAAYFGWDPLPVRILLIVLCFVTSLSVVIPYLIAWMIIPAAKTAEQKLRMQGKEITVENIGKTVAADSIRSQEPKKKGCLGGFIEAIGGFLKVCFVGLGCLVGGPVLFALAIIVIVLIAILFGIGNEMLGWLPFGWGSATHFVEFSHPTLATIAFVVLWAIPLIVLIYAIVSYFAHLQPLSKGVKWVTFGIWIIVLVLFLCSGWHVNEERFFENSGINWNNNKEAIVGNGEMSEKRDILISPIETIVIEDKLIAQVQIEQAVNDTTTILLRGDENLLNRVAYEIHDRTLHLSTEDNRPFRTKNSFIVRIQTPNLQKLKMESVGSVTIRDRFKADTLMIWLNGAGKVTAGELVAQSLQVRLDGAGKVEAGELAVQSLNVQLDGVGKATLSGQAKKAVLNLNGTGKIDAGNLVADSVFAELDGVGKIQCNPVIFIQKRVNGIGKISCKNEFNAK